MNILFLNPPFKGRFSRTSRSPAVTKGGTLYYPIWLAYAAGTAEDAGHEIRLIDAPAEGLDFTGVLAALKDFEPDLCVVDTSTPSIYNDVEIAGRLKDRFPDAFTLLVGTHPSALPEETLGLDPRVDGAAVGEYDFTVRDLAACLEAKSGLDSVEGLAFRENGAILRTPDRERILDLDALPFVSAVYRKHLNYRNYFFAAANYPMVMIITGRGCPFRCFFCVYPQVFHSRRYRPRSPERVVDEFAYIATHFPGIREIGIEDDCFTADRRHVRRICELLIERKITIPWYCNARGDVDLETLKLMKAAGCRLVTVGFESGVQAILDGMHKGETVEKYYRFAADAEKAGIMVHGCLMAGTPGDTEKTQEESFQFALKINCDSMQFYPLYVYPGTEAYAWAKENGYLLTEDYSRWLTPEGLHNCVLDTPGLSAERMVALCDHNLKRYHLRPAYLTRKLAQAIRYPSEGYRSLKSGWVFLNKVARGQVQPGDGRAVS